MADLADHQIDRALMHLDLFAIDQDRVEQPVGEVAAHRPLGPVILGGHRPGDHPHRLRQRRPDHDRVQVAGVVGEIDPLAGIGLRIDPAHAGSAQDAGDHGQKVPREVRVHTPPPAGKPSYPFGPLRSSPRPTGAECKAVRSPGFSRPVKRGRRRSPGNTSRFFYFSWRQSRPSPPLPPPCGSSAGQGWIWPRKCWQSILRIPAPCDRRSSGQ